MKPVSVTTRLLRKLAGESLDCRLTPLGVDHQDNFISRGLRNGKGRCAKPLAGVSGMDNKTN